MAVVVNRLERLLEQLARPLARDTCRALRRLCAMPGVKDGR